MDGPRIAMAGDRTGEVDCRAVLQSPIRSSWYEDGGRGASEKAKREAKEKVRSHCGGLRRTVGD